MYFSVKLMDFLEEKFKGVVDKAGNPYIVHCLDVAKNALTIAQRLSDIPQYSISTAYFAGLCHDLLEDTDTTVEELEELIGKEATEIVKLCTHSTPYNRKEYDNKILENKIATIVKMSDFIDNSRTDRYPSEKITKNVISQCNAYKKRAGEFATALLLNEFKEK